MRDRGRDVHYWAPPAQNRTCGFPAYGSHLGWVTANLPYALQRWCHAYPTLRPARALLARIPLGLGPWLHRLRRGCLRFVRRLPSYYGLVRLPAPVHHRLRLLAFPMRTAGLISQRPDAGYPSFRHDPSARDVLFDPGRAAAPRI